MVPSASLIPHDPTVLFTIAGMVPFKPYFVGDEAPPWPRATSVQKCFRTVDIEIIGTTLRHFTFFEMLGNFSFGDYFKSEAIPFAWELFTEVLGIDADRLWVTVHDSDDEAAALWTKTVGVPHYRVQRMGADNFWKMGDTGTGPCGPSSEIYYDRGERYGPSGGPALGGEERYVELYNLVFMQYNQLPDGSTEDLPKRNIDTGAGLERVLPILQGVESPYETDLLRPVVATAEQMTGTTYGAHEQTDMALRVLADHARAMTMLVADGVLPSNEGRGYVLRRVIRRAVLRAQRLGVTTPSDTPLRGVRGVGALGRVPVGVVGVRRHHSDRDAVKRTSSSGRCNPARRSSKRSSQAALSNCRARSPSGCTTHTAFRSISPSRWPASAVYRWTSRASKQPWRHSASGQKKCFATP